MNVVQSFLTRVLPERSRGSPIFNLLEGIINMLNSISKIYFSTYMHNFKTFAGVLNDRTLGLKYFKINLNAFWLLVEKGYPAIEHKVL